MRDDSSGSLIESSAWARLRAHTPARIGLARAGASLSTSAVLELRAAHAAARDAVWKPMDRDGLRAELEEIGASTICVASRAESRRAYLMRPDFGRSLNAASARGLSDHFGTHDLAIVIADGLSSAAVELHATPLIKALLPLLSAPWRTAPLVIAEAARVALGDEIANLLGATGVLVLIGERPGLSATDSLGAYLTWGVKPGLTDADRNCVSNIRPGGLDYEEAARQIAFLLFAARDGGYSGVALKNRFDETLGPAEP